MPVSVLAATGRVKNFSARWDFGETQGFKTLCYINFGWNIETWNGRFRERAQNFDFAG